MKFNFAAISTFIALAAQAAIAAPTSDTSDTANNGGYGGGNGGHITFGHFGPNCYDICYPNWEPCAAEYAPQHIDGCWTCCKTHHY
jgi:predicted lipoprotein with Yx(FWY)xxD motif